MSGKRFKIEAIPDVAAKFYALVARKSPCLRDIHVAAAEEVCARISSGRILDVGTGPGYLPFEIARRNPGLDITGIDLAPKMVEIANKNARELGLSERVKFKIANAGSLPFEDGYFDLVVSTLSLHHWLNPAGYIKEIHRVLKDKGEIDIYDLRRDTTKEVNAGIRAKYGWFMAFVFLKIVRAHSSITLKEAQEIISSLEVSFSQKSVQEKGIILCLQLIK